MTGITARISDRIVSSRQAIRVDMRTLLAVATTVVLWASAFPAIRAGLQAYSPAHVALLRYLIASAALMIYAIFNKLPLPRLRDIPPIALTGFIGITCYNMFLNTGETRVPAAIASFIVAAAPIYMALIGTLLFHERLRLWGWLGILISFTGVTVIAFGNNSIGVSGLQITPQLVMVMLAPVAQSIFVTSQKPFLKRYSAFQFTAYALWSGTFFLLVFLPGLLDEIKAAPIRSTLAVTYLGLFPAALGYGTWAYALARFPASRAGSFLYLVPLVALIISWLWLSEIPSLLALVGGVLVLAGVIVVNTRGKLRPKS